MSDPATKALAKLWKAEAERDAARRALAESQAREQELRAAAGHFSKTFDRWAHGSGTRGAQGADVVFAAADIVDRTLSRPSDQTALRELLIRVVRLMQNDASRGHAESFVDAVLKGEP